MNIQFDGQQVIIPIDKAILVLTHQQFLKALEAGKRFRRQQAMANRVAKAEEVRTE